MVVAPEEVFTPPYVLNKTQSLFCTPGASYKAGANITTPVDEAWVRSLRYKQITGDMSAISIRVKSSTLVRFKFDVSCIVVWTNSFFFFQQAIYATELDRRAIDEDGLEAELIWAKASLAEARTTLRRRDAELEKEKEKSAILAEEKTSILAAKSVLEQDKAMLLKTIVAKDAEIKSLQGQLASALETAAMDLVASEEYSRDMLDNFRDGFWYCAKKVDERHPGHGIDFPSLVGSGCTSSAPGGGDGGAGDA